MPSTIAASGFLFEVPAPEGGGLDAPPDGPAMWAVVEADAMTRFMDELMAEKISYGGLVASRIDAYRHALGCLLSRADCPSRQAAQRGADMFAFGPRAVALSDDEVAYREGVGLVMDPATGEPVRA